MPKPQYSQLLELSELVAKVQKLEAKLQVTQEDLEQKKEDYKNKEELEASNLREKIKVSQNLEKFHRDLEILREEELVVRQNLEEKIEEAINNYFAGNSFHDFLSRAIKDIKAKENDSQVVVSSNMQKYLGQIQPDTVKEEKGILRVISPTKEYIFDLEEVKKILRKKLLEASLAS